MEEYNYELIHDVEALFSQVLNEVIPDEKYHITIEYRCEKCFSYGKQDEYCKNDGKKLTKKEPLKWESLEETARNKTIKEMLLKAKKLGIDLTPNQTPEEKELTGGKE